MAQFDPLWLEHQRRRWMPPNAERWIRPQTQGWMRPSSQLFLSPRPDGRKDSAELAVESLDLAAEREELLQLRSELETLKAEIKFRQLLRDSKAYNPDQPRVPAGNPDGGEWTNGDSSPSMPSRLYVAGGMPRIPGQRPPSSRERTAIAKAVAIWLAEKAIAAGEVIAKSSWLYHAIPYINSYLDPPKPLEELQQDASTPKTGYDRHHIVEQTSAEEDGYPRRRIDDPDNLVRYPSIEALGDQCVVSDAESRLR